jgi:hypothetical protein
VHNLVAILHSIVIGIICGYSDVGVTPFFLITIINCICVVLYAELYKAK